MSSPNGQEGNVTSSEQSGTSPPDISGTGSEPSNNIVRERININDFWQSVMKMDNEKLFELLEEMKKTQDEEFAVKMKGITNWREFVERAQQFKESVEDIMKEITKAAKPGEQLLETFRQFLEQFKLMMDQYVVGHDKLLKALQFSSTFYRKALEFKERNQEQPSISTKGNQETSTSQQNSSASSSSAATTRNERKRRCTTENDVSEVGTEEETAL